MRKHLGEDKAIVLREGRLKLDERYCWLDTWAFEEVQAKIDALFKGQRQFIDDEKVTRLTDKMLALDGEGGYKACGKLMPARDSLLLTGLPIGLANSA